MLEKVTGATTEPITLGEAKAHLRVLTDDDDQLIRGYIKAATAYCEQAVPGSRSLVRQTWDWKKHDFLADSFDLPRPPLQSVTHIKYYATNTSTGLTTLSSTAYLVHKPDRLPGTIELHPNKGAWPTVADRADAVQIRFVAGYTTIPEQAKHAIKLLVAHYYEDRSAILTGTISKEVEFGVKELVGQLGYGDYS
tara:strand:+ start:578 stop:1159 length:582 start_codon:yes stop_codon:yes gene_type:complete